MISLVFKSGLPLQIVLLLVCGLTSAAPAHHLTIGVQGNTPTLFVTSSEIGIASESERSRLKTQKVNKNISKQNEKLKYQKVKASVSNKKGKYSLQTKTLVSTPIPRDALKCKHFQEALRTEVETHIPPTLNSTQKPMDDRQTTSLVTHLVTPTTVVTVTENYTPSQAIILNERNVALSEGATTENLTLLLESMQPSTETLTESPSKAIKQQATTVSSIEAIPTTSESTHSSLYDVGTTMEAEGTQIIEVINVSEKTNSHMHSDDLHSMYTTSTEELGSGHGHTSEDTTLSTLTLERTTESQTESIESIVETEISSSVQIPLQTTVFPMVSTDFTEQEPTTPTNEPILKLIDLEKHNSKPSEGSAELRVGHDNGHDGLKNIKKKQLLDKHYLDVPPNPKLEESRIVGDTSTIMPVRHAYLGPILMEEKTFHVIHGNTPFSNRSHHPTSVEAQLRLSNFVEIKPSNVEGKSEPNATSKPLPLFSNTGGVALDDDHGHGDPDGALVLSSTTFEVSETMASNLPVKSSSSLVTPSVRGSIDPINSDAKKSESKISDIQIEIYDSTIDSIVASTNFKDIPQGKTTKPPGSVAQQERFTQYVIDRTETSTQESINFSTIQVASGIPEPAAIEIHINVSESFNNDNEDQDILFPQGDYSNTGHVDDVYDDVKEKDEIKLKAPANAANLLNKDRSDEVLVVEIVDNGNNGTDAKVIPSIPNVPPHAEESDSTPPPPPPPPPYQRNFDRDSDTIFYISNTEVKVGESPPNIKKAYDERKMKLENQFFPANYMASTHPNTADEHHLYEEDIILSSDRNQADSLKIYRNRNDPSPPLDVTYVGESIIEVEQSPDTGITTTSAPDHVVTPQPDVIIQPAILPEISIGVPVIGELPPQIELKEIDYMPNEAQVHRSGVYGNEDSIGNADNRLDDSSIQYGGDLIDESADGGFDGVEGSYPFGNPEQRKKSHVGDFAHLYINYGVNNMRKDELTADVKDSGEINVIVSNSGGNVIEQNVTSKDLINKVSFSNITGLNESERISNVTAFSIMEDPNELEEKNTEDIINLISLAIGLFIVILPVVVTCSMLWALRYLYKKYHYTSADSNGNLDPADGKGLPSDDAAEKGESSPSHCDKDDIQKCPETFKEPSEIDNSSDKFSAENPNPTQDSSIDLHCKMHSYSSKNRDCPILLPLDPASSAIHIHTVHDESPPGPNGSVTKMTLENNLLIVETEERNDISRVAREMKMDYHKDGVFVVEVARGIDSRTIPESPVADGSEKLLSMFETKHNSNPMGYKLSHEKVSHNNERVQIHSPPPEKTDEGPQSLHKIEEVDEPAHSPRPSDANLISKTGLSQSDLSSTSSNDSNKDYCYGNQELYVVEQVGYCTSLPSVNVTLKCDTKDIKDDDQNSENGPYLEHSPRKEEGEPKKTEDVLDTVNRSSKNDKLDEKPKMQGQKESQLKVKVEYEKKNEERRSDQIMCNDHKEADNTPTENCVVESKLLNTSIQSNGGEMPEDSINENKQQLQCNTNNILQELHQNVKANDGDLLPEKSSLQQTVLAEGNKHLAQDIIESIKEEEETVGETQPIIDSIDTQMTATESDNVRSNFKLLEVVLEETFNQTEAERCENACSQLNGLNETMPQENENESEKENEKFIPEKLKKLYLNTNGVVKEEDEEEEEEDDNVSLLTNGTHILPDVVPSGKALNLTNGHVISDLSSNSNTDLENGYDSIMSLPDPPTSDEIYCSVDISEQQMDSLPPPPPPMLNELNGETFNLKDLPPPMTNCETTEFSSLPKEDSNNYYATLPPPPLPTTLAVSMATTGTAHGNMHPSPLTPPASPPPHFSNGLHSHVMCPPIAVDVNGS